MAKFSKYTEIGMNGGMERDQWVFNPNSMPKPLKGQADELHVPPGEFPQVFHGGSPSPEEERINRKFKELAGS